MSKSMRAKSIAIIVALAFVFTTVFAGIGSVAFAAGSNRLFGNNRYETAVEISKAGWTSSDDVVLVSGEDFPDALAAGPLAKKLDAPILLTQKDVLPDVTKAEIAKLGATKVYIVGGEGVVSKAVADATGVNVERIAGNDRFETAVAVAQKIKDLGGSVDKVVLARSDDYADALAAAAVTDVVPVLFADRAGATALQDATAAALDDLGVKDVVIAGGTGVVSADIAAQVKSIIGKDATRLAGDDRFETAVAIANAFKPAAGYKGAVLATGYDYADALVGGPYAAKKGYAMLLAGKAANPLDQSAVDFIKANAGIKADAIVALGGSTVVPDAALNAAVDAATPPVPAILSVKAIDSDTVRVTFNTEIQDVDFNNFSVDHGLTVVKATLSSDKKSVDVDVNTAFTREVEYKLTASSIKNLKGETAADLTATFVWSVQDAVTVALTKTSLTVGETAGVTIKDQDGKDVIGATVEITSSNTNIVSVSGATITGVAAGSADVTVKVTLPDGTVLTNTFKVTVASSSTVVANQGYTLVDDITTDAPENTVAFVNGSKTTSMYTGESKEVAMYNTINGDPDTAPVDFTGATVRSLNPTIATASISGSVMTITASTQTGTASFEVTLKDGSKRTFSVDVKKAPELTGITVSATNVKLSDETATGSDQEGVNQKTVTVTAVDQYGNPIDFGSTGKVTVTTNTEGLVINKVAPLTNNELTFGTGASSATFTITATAGTIKSGNVYVKYFKNKADAAPAITKTIAVNVVDINPTATKVALDVVAPSEIDAYADYTASTSDVSSIDFSTEVYVLDASGNRLEKVTPTTVALVGSDSWVSISGSTTLQFTNGAKARTFLTKSGTVNVDVTAAGITKRLAIKYINSAKVPASATVNTAPVTVKLASGDTDLTVEELIFGVLDGGQLVNDPDINEYIAVKKAASNGGYKYNKPLVTVKDASGSVLPIGANVYGVDNTAITGNIWADEQAVPSEFSGYNFAIGSAIVNVETTGSGSVSGNTISVTSAGDAVRFTLVINSIYVSGGTASDNNLLASPVAVNVTVTK